MLTVRVEDGGTIEGVIECRVAVATLVEVAIPPHALTGPSELTDIQRQWQYPQGGDRPHTTVWHEGRGMKDAAWQSVGTFAAGEVVRLRFRTLVSRRAGLLGRHDVTLYALSGWHPLLGSGGVAWQLDWNVSALLPRDAVGFVGRTRKLRRETHASTRFVGAEVPMLLTHQADVREAGAHIVIWPRGEVAPNQALFAAVREAQERLHDRSHDVRSLLIVVGPLREHLVEPFEGGLMISDRAFVGIEQVTRYHFRSLVEALARALGLPPPESVAVPESMDSVVRPFAVIPELQELAYAPQIPFASSYFTSARAERGLGSWQFVLNNVFGVLALHQGELQLAADFSLRQEYDPTTAYHVRAETGPLRTGISASQTYAFGASVTPLRLVHQLGWGVSADRLHGARATEQVVARVFYNYDTRLSPYSSLTGMGLRVSAQVGAPPRELSRVPSRVYARVGAAALKLWSAGDAAALATRVRFDRELGPTPAQEELDLSHWNLAARGFPRDLARGHTRAVATLEYRRVLHGAGSDNLLGWLLLTTLEGVLFTDVVYLRGGTSCEVPYVDLGYGLHVGGEWLGLVPGVLAIDVGLGHDACSSSRPLTYAVHVGVQQSLWSF